MSKCLTVVALVLLVLTGAMGLRNIVAAGATSPIWAIGPGTPPQASPIWAIGPGTPPQASAILAIGPGTPPRASAIWAIGPGTPPRAVR